MDKGKICILKKSPEQISQFVKERLAKLPDEHKRFKNPHIYKVGISEKLMKMRNEMVNNLRTKKQTK